MGLGARKPFDLPCRYWWLTVAGLILGLFVTMQGQPPVVGAPVTPGDPRELSGETIKRLEAEQKALKLAVTDRRARLTDLQKNASGQKAILAELSAEMESQRMLAGMVPVVGPGVQVILDNSNVRTIPPGEDAGGYLVQDYDIRDVVSLLWRAGAEAIAVGDERAVGTTSVYQVSGTILVNDTKVPPPYRVTAIGPPTMEEVLNSPSRLERLKANVRQYGVQLRISQEKEVQVPAFSGRSSSRYARPVDSE